MNRDIMCPHCQATLPAPPGGGEPFACPFCGQSVEPAAAEPPPASAETFLAALGGVLVIAGIIGGLFSLGVIWAADSLGGNYDRPGGPGTLRVIGGLVSTAAFTVGAGCIFKAGVRPGFGQAGLVGVGLVIAGLLGWVVVFSSCAR